VGNAYENIRPNLNSVGMGIALALALCTVAYGSSVSWTEYTADPVYSPGKAYYPSVIEVGSTYMMWSQDDSDGGEQMATSPDGITWTTKGQVSGLTYPPTHAVVERIGNVYQMWYDDSSALYSIDAIRTATSNDGLIWTNDQPITQVGNTVVTGQWPSWNTGSYGAEDILFNPLGSSSIVDPVDGSSVWANKFVMYYDGTTGDDESVGLAVSNDGINWEGYDGGTAPVLDSSATGWDSGYVGYGTVIQLGPNAFEFWYSAGKAGDYVLNQGIGYATSTDGIHWVKDPSNPIFDISDGVAWRDERTYTPMVIGDQMWFSGVSSSGVYSIGYATESSGVPEPSSAGLLALGGVTLLICRRKRTVR
jgi:hypothetical protein